MLCYARPRSGLIALLFVVLAPATLAATFTVNDTGDAADATPGNGICATAGAVCTLRAAVQEANALAGADIITLPAGTYNLTAGALFLQSDITINGAGSATTIIDGQALDSVLYADIPAGSRTVNNVTIRNGLASYGGGVIVDNGVTLNLANAIITGNTASSLGTAQGGGIYVSVGGTLNLTDSTVSLNDAGNGGGGVRVLSGSTANIERSTIRANTSLIFGSGGAGIASQGSLSLVNSTISGNTTASGGYGQGLSVEGGTASLVNVTIAANNSGAGNQFWTNSGTTTTILATIIANPLAGTNCLISVGTLVDNGYNLDSGATCGFSGTGTLNSTNPNLGSLANNGGPTLTHALVFPSPAIDAGTSSGTPTVDQRGVARPQGAAHDIGAFEFMAAASTPEIGISGNATVIADGDGSPSPADHTDFGSTTEGLPLSRTFTINNTGTGVLTLGANAVTLVGGGCWEFSVTAQPASTVAVSGSTTFTLQYLALNVGTGTCTVNVNNDDADENPYDFAIQGTTLPSPEITIYGNSNAIADGDLTPSLTDHTDFGNTTVGTPISRNFTISNTGTAVLNLGANAVTLTGPGCGEFSVTVQPPTSLATSVSSSFVVQYLPTNTGTDSCTVNVNSDDLNENPYNFAIQGAVADASALGATAIPTLSPWGLGLLSGVLGLAFVFGQRRRRH